MSQLLTFKCCVFLPPDDYATDVCSISIHSAPLPDTVSPTIFKTLLLLTA